MKDIEYSAIYEERGDSFSFDSAAQVERQLVSIFKLLLLAVLSHLGSCGGDMYRSLDP